MNPKYLKYGLYTLGFIAVLAIAYMIAKAIKKGAGAVGSIGDAIQDNRTDKAIAKATGISLIEVNDARKIAIDVAKELETYKDLTGWTKAKNFVTDDAIMDIIKQVKTPGMMLAVSVIYNNEMTNNHTLKEDLKDELSNALFLKVPFIQNLK